MNTDSFPKTQLEVFRYFADEATCHEFFAAMRWQGGKPVCPECGSKEIGDLSVVKHKSRSTKEGAEAKTLTRRLWTCKACRTQFTVKKGSLFEDSPLGLDKWLCGLWLIVNAKNGISSCEIGRTLGITQKSAWFLSHRLRLALHEGSFEKLSGNVEVDETFIGGKARLMNNKAKAKRRALHGKRTGWSAMTPVQGLLERSERKGHSRVKVKVIPSTRHEHVQPGVRDYVVHGSTVHTDEHGGYVGLNDAFTHKVINHAECYARGNVHTNGMENFWSVLKRAIKGTYVSVEPFHLFRYLDEQVFRFNERKDADGDRGRFLRAIAGLAGKRLTWSKLTGKDLPDCLMPA